MTVKNLKPNPTPVAPSGTSAVSTIASSSNPNANQGQPPQQKKKMMFALTPVRADAEIAVIRP